MEGNPTRVREHLRLIAPAVGKLVSESRRFSVFEDSERVVESLREWRPLHLSGYGSAIGRLFRHLKESGESIPLPRVVTFSSDAMAPLERCIIEEDFGVPVLGIYSSTEAFAIGGTSGEVAGAVGRLVGEEGRGVRTVMAISWTPIAHGLSLSRRWRPYDAKTIRTSARRRSKASVSMRSRLRLSAATPRPLAAIRSGARLVMSSPAKTTRPPLTADRFDTALRNVDFPAPLVPSRARNSPSTMFRSRWLRTRWHPTF